MPGLPRYDAETFRSLRRVENPSMQIFPSVHVPGEPNLQELAVLPGSGTPLSYTPVSRIKPVQGSPLLMKPEPVNWPQVLFEHVNFGMHRLYFLLNRLPGVAMLMVATWIVWGRGATTDNKIKLFEAEKGMGISAVVVASFHLVTIIVGSMNHNNSPKRALYQTIYRSIASFVNAAAVIVVIVFAAVACSKLSSFKDNLATLTECAGLCYSQKERITFAAVILGLGVMMILLSVCAFFHAVLGAYNLHKLMKKTKKPQKFQRSYVQFPQARLQASYNNPGVTGDSDYY